ncbi:MAG: SusC/RagA family TonB-linked outer membrane protein [Sphingobacteriales bacterium]|nr:MAG: SusC/RagA family TonB-linked outer membrane protein [Sphingobacteriales bacterium]
MTIFNKNSRLSIKKLPWWREFLNEGFKNVGLATFPQDVLDKINRNAAPDLTKGWMYGLTSYPGFYGYTDWNKVLYKSSSQQIHNVSISGGGDNNNYLISAGYKRDNGVLRFGKNKSDGYNLRLNYDVRLNSKLAIETRTNFDNQATLAPSQLDAESPITNVTRQFPFAPLYNSVGQFYSYQGYANPAGYAEEGGVRNDNFSRFATNFKVDYTVISGLKLTGQASFRFDYNNYRSTFPTFTRYNYAGGVQDIRHNPNYATFSNSKTLNKLYQVYLDYNKDLWAGHHINFTGGASLEQGDFTSESVTGYNFPNNELFSLNLADRTKAAYANFTGSINDRALGSYFGRLSYSYNNKLFLDLTARADGSSKFAPEKRWSAVFPSAQLAYVLSEEEFIKKANLFDLLKLRISYGKAGNQEIGSLGLYDYIPLISVGGNYPIGSPNAGLTGANARPASSDRTWETVTNRNIGLDIAVLKSRLNFSFDYYTKTNNDMLVNIAVPATFGATPPSTNQGKLETKGFEAMVTWKDQVSDFKYSISLQVSDSKNKLVELKNSDSYGEGLNFTRKGYPIYSYFGYVDAGIIKTQAQLDEYKKLQGIPARVAIGDVMYKDVDGDGKLTAFGDQTKGLAGDMVYLGNVNPRYTFSSNINLAYKGIDLQVFMQGVGKRDVIYEGNIRRPNDWFWPSLAYFYGNTYTPENPDAKFPRHLPGGLGYDDVMNYDYKPSTRTLQNVAYLRMKNIQVGYTLPSKWINRIGGRTAKVFFSGENLFTYSPMYKIVKNTIDVENAVPSDQDLNAGSTNGDGYNYPLMKSFSLGLNIGF